MTGTRLKARLDGLCLLDLEDGRFGHFKSLVEVGVFADEDTIDVESCRLRLIFTIKDGDVVSSNGEFHCGFSFFPLGDWHAMIDGKCSSTHVGQRPCDTLSLGTAVLWYMSLWHQAHSIFIGSSYIKKLLSPPFARAQGGRKS